MDTQSDSSDILKELENMIQTLVSSIDREKEELKNVREMISSYLNGDPTYQEHEKQAKEAAKKRNATKLTLLTSSSGSPLVSKLKDLRTHLKDQQNSLSEYLREFHRISGSNEITDSQGDVREIVYVARLVKRSSKNT
jgi:uncharacterized protein YbaP (TraB family)